MTKIVVIYETFIVVPAHKSGSFSSRGGSWHTPVVHKLFIHYQMDFRHHSRAMRVIMLWGEDTHPWSATKEGNPIQVTIPVTTKNYSTNKLLILATIPVD